MSGSYVSAILKHWRGNNQSTLKHLHVFKMSQKPGRAVPLRGQWKTSLYASNMHSTNSILQSTGDGIHSDTDMWLSRLRNTKCFRFWMWKTTQSDNCQENTIYDSANCSFDNCELVRPSFTTQWLVNTLFPATTVVPATEIYTTSKWKPIRTILCILLTSAEGLSHRSYGIPNSTFTPLSLQPRKDKISETLQFVGELKTHGTVLDFRATTHIQSLSQVK